MTTKLKLNLIIFTVSILIPYLTLILFIRTVSMFVILPIYLVALIFLIISTIEIRRIEKKNIYLLTAVMAIVLFFLSYGYQLDAADWLFFKLRESRLTICVNELKNYKKITEMSDGQRFWKTINGTSVEADIKNVDTTENGFGKKYLLSDILKRDQIDKQHYDFIRQILVNNQIESLITLDDGTISFTIDGFLDNCYGIAYSETGKRPRDNDCGQIIYWKKVGDNWYAWRTT